MSHPKEPKLTPQFEKGLAQRRRLPLGSLDKELCAGAHVLELKLLGASA